MRSEVLGRPLQPVMAKCILTHLTEKQKICNSAFLGDFLVLGMERVQTRCTAFRDLRSPVLTHPKSFLPGYRFLVSHA